MAPRSREKVLKSEFAEMLVSYRPLDPTLGLLTSPLESWFNSALLVIEVPLLEFGKWAVHLALQRLLLRIRSEGPNVMLIVTPRRGDHLTSKRLV